MADQPPKGFGKIDEPRVSFADQLSVLCAREITLARKDPDRKAVMIERLINSLAFTIAMACDGDAKALSEMTEGASAHLFERAADHAKVARMMAP